MRTILLAFFALVVLLPSAAAAYPETHTISPHLSRMDNGIPRPDCGRILPRITEYKHDLLPILKKFGAKPATLERLQAADRLSDYNAVAPTLNYGRYGAIALMRLLAEGKELEHWQQSCQA